MEGSITPFLLEQCQKGIIDSDRVSELLSLVDAGIPLDALLGSPLNLHEDFIHFHNNLMHKNQTTGVQQQILVDRLGRLRKHIAETQIQINLLESEVKEPRLQLEYCSDRLKIFLENPRFQKQVAEQNKKLAPTEARIAKSKEQLDQLEAELARLTTTLESTIPEVNND